MTRVMKYAKITMGAKVAIIGAGPIGILLLKAIRLQGAADLTVVDRVASKAAFAGLREVYVQSAAETERVNLFETPACRN